MERRPRPSTLAWAGLIGGIAAWDALCPQGESLSERLDPIIEKPIGRVFVYAAIGTTALHLSNLLPEQLDPFSRVGSRYSSLRMRRGDGVS